MRKQNQEKEKLKRRKEKEIVCLCLWLWELEARFMASKRGQRGLSITRWKGMMMTLKGLYTLHYSSYFFILTSITMKKII